MSLLVLLLHSFIASQSVNDLIDNVITSNFDIKQTAFGNFLIIGACCEISGRKAVRLA